MKHIYVFYERGQVQSEARDNPYDRNDLVVHLPHNARIITATTTAATTYAFAAVALRGSTPAHTLHHRF
jgi:hypothetical protein